MATDIEKAMSKILTRLGYRYYEQFEFYSYIVDFYIPEFMIAIEADGKVWHSKIKDEKRDIELMKRHGVKVLHFVDDIILKHPEYVEASIVSEILATTYRRVPPWQ